MGAAWGNPCCQVYYNTHIRTVRWGWVRLTNRSSSCATRYTHPLLQARVDVCGSTQNTSPMRLVISNAFEVIMTSNNNWSVRRHTNWVWSCSTTAAGAHHSGTCPRLPRLLNTLENTHWHMCQTNEVASAGDGAAPHHSGSKVGRVLLLTRAGLLRPQPNVPRAKRTSVWRETWPDRQGGARRSRG